MSDIIRTAGSLDAPRSSLLAPAATAAARPVPLPRPGYDELTLYSPNVDACAVDLSDNTNLWGAPPAAARAVRDGSAGEGPNALTRYPVLYANALKPHLAAYAGGAPHRFVLSLRSTAHASTLGL